MGGSSDERHIRHALLWPLKEVSWSVDEPGLRQGQSGDGWLRGEEGESEKLGGRKGETESVEEGVDVDVYCQSVLSAQDTL